MKNNNVFHILKKIEQKFPLFYQKNAIIHKELNPPDYAISKECLEEVKNFKLSNDKYWPYYQSSHNLSPPKNHKDYLLIAPYVYELGSYLGAYTVPLVTFYNNHGYVGWHNNADVPGRNLLFTWSEKGDGIFRMYKEKEDKFVDYSDQSGWAVKTTVFYSDVGAEKYGYSWHSMYTKCKRFSLAYRILDNAMTKDTLYELGLEY